MVDEQGRQHPIADRVQDVERALKSPVDSRTLTCRYADVKIRMFRIAVSSHVTSNQICLMKSIIIYCRAPDGQNEGTTLESQEAACREYAKSKNLVILRVSIE